ncbi:TPA: hypothetical protein ACK0CK_002639 [Staphylococcus aureus]
MASSSKEKQPFIKYYRFSLKLGVCLKWALIILILFFVMKILIVKMLGMLVSLLQDSITANPNGLLNSIFPNAGEWDKVFPRLENIFNDLIYVTMIVTAIFMFIYILLILLRHRNGEHAPLLNDIEAYRIKRIIIRNTEASNKKTYKDRNDKIQRMPRNEFKANRQIRKCRVEIHTFNRENHKKPFKTYRVQFERLKSNKANEYLVNKIISVPESLNAEIDASFSEIEPFKKNYVTTVEKQLDKEKKSVIVKMRERQLEKKATVEEAVNDNKEVEFSYPLDLFVDRKAEIRDKRERADEKAKEWQELIKRHLISKKIYVETSNYTVQTVLVEMRFALPANTKQISETTLENEIDIRLRANGTSVNVSEGLLIIVSPLPPECHIPIDVKEMLETVTK